MNKRAAVFLLSAVIGMGLFPAAAFAAPDKGSEIAESGVIVREVMEENESTDTAATGTESENSAAEATADGDVEKENTPSKKKNEQQAASAEPGSVQEIINSLEKKRSGVVRESRRIGTVMTDGTVLNVRSGRGTDYGIIDTLENGDEVEVLEDHGDWLYVSVPEHKGYVYAEYLDVRTVPVEVEQDGALSFSLDSELLQKLIEQAAGNNADSQSDASGRQDEAAEETSAESGLTPTGNLNLVDDYGAAVRSGKQFITMVTKSGNYFYLIIDRDDEGDETVHFLNQVDEEDLFALMDEDAVTEMKEEIAAEEAAKEAERKAEEAAKAAAEEKAEAERQAAEQPEKKKANPALIILPLLLVFGGIGGYFYLKTQRAKRSAAGQDPDAGYPDDEMMDIYELPEEPDEKKSAISEDDPDYWLDEEDE